LESQAPISNPRPSSLRGNELALTGQHALVVRREGEFELPDEAAFPLPPWHRPEWQNLWLALERQDWRTLALVPPGPSRPGFTLDVAVGLVHTGSVHLGVPIRIADAVDISLPHLRQFIQELNSLREAGDRVLVCLGGVRNNSTTAPIAQAADRALLCLELNQSKLADAKATMKAVGQKHFLGSAVFQK